MILTEQERAERPGPVKPMRRRTAVILLSWLLSTSRRR
jgi:hypothetical protein